jgi:protein-S-isoprenylcysteine O-methyltransferase Ste14
MDPQILRAGFRIATFVTATAAVLLFFEPRESAEFVVSVMALVIGLTFVSVVAVLVWYSTPKMPRAHNAPVQRRRKEQ